MQKTRCERVADGVGKTSRRVAEGADVDLGFRRAKRRHVAHAGCGTQLVGDTPGAGTGVAIRECDDETGLRAAVARRRHVDGRSFRQSGPQRRELGEQARGFQLRVDAAPEADRHGRAVRAGVAARGDDIAERADGGLQRHDIARRHVDRVSACRRRELDRGVELGRRRAWQVIEGEARRRDHGEEHDRERNDRAGGPMHAASAGARRPDAAAG